LVPPIEKPLDPSDEIWALESSRRQATGDEPFDAGFASSCVGSSCLGGSCFAGSGSRSGSSQFVVAAVAAACTGSGAVAGGFALAVFSHPGFGPESQDRADESCSSADLRSSTVRWSATEESSFETQASLVRISPGSWLAATKTTPMSAAIDSTTEPSAIQVLRPLYDAMRRTRRASPAAKRLNVCPPR
jgi:hypothetical protein